MDPSVKTASAYVGSMGLHQNNGNGENSTNWAINFKLLTNRSVIDVFRGIRDRYFGKPEVLTPLQRKLSQQNHDTGKY